MTEREIVLTAVVVVLAAVVAVGMPWWVVAAATVLFVAARRPVVAVVPLALMSSALAARAEAGLNVAPRSVDGVATVVTDPESRPGGVVVELRIDGHRYRSFVADDLAAELVGVSAGDELSVDGRVGPLSGPWEWRASRHLAGRLAVRSVRRTSEGAGWWRSANWMHHTVEAGLGSFDPDVRALFLGIVFGDDRGQSELEQFRFRASGLGHLTAVSGQNVAFVLVAASPLLRRLRLRWRWAATVVLLGWFALVTRLEPSVLRAVAMSAVAATAATSGRYATGVRILSVAVIGLVLVDPLLVWSLGFRLSVAASIALVTLARPLARVLPGPQVVADLTAVSLAAQVGTAPLLLGLSGTVPALGPLANLLAVPVAGWLMVWGVVTGPIAGLMGEPVAAWIGIPSRLMVGWLSGVADAFSGPGLPRLGALGVAGMSVVVAALLIRNALRASRSGANLAARLAIAALGVGMIAAAVDAGGLVTERTVSEGPVSVWSDGDAAVMAIGAGADEEGVLGTLLQCRCPRLDVVIVTGGGQMSSAAVYSLRQVVEVGAVLAADPASIRDAGPLVEGAVAAGSLRIEITRPSGGATGSGALSVSSSDVDRRPRGRAGP